MLSLGTDWLLALAIASARVGLPPTSPPPVRAATSMFLISLANSLPRLASTTAFLCLVVAHFEWPLMLASTFCTDVASHVAEVPMHPGVTGQFRMERGGQQMPLANGDHLTGGWTG